MRPLPTDIRTTKTFVQEMLEGFDELFRINKQLSMDPLKFQRHMEYLYRDAERAERAAIKRRVRQAFQRLCRAECITEQNGAYSLTTKGWWRYLEHYARGIRKIKKKQKKSRKVFVVMFDIPEEFRHFRNMLRRILKNLHFESFQQSVYLTRNEEHVEILSRILAQTELVDRVKLIVGDQIL